MWQYIPCSARRAAKYTVVGLLGTVVKVAALVLLHDRYGVDGLVATVLAVQASMIHNFAWHLRWTWRDRSCGLSGVELAVRLLRFQTGNGAVALLVNLIAISLLTGRAGFGFAAAGTLASIAGGAVNFLLSNRWVFTRRASTAKAGPRLPLGEVIS